MAGFEEEFEKIRRQNRMGCVFRIVEHTNYHLSSILTVVLEYK